MLLCAVTGCRARAPGQSAGGDAAVVSAEARDGAVPTGDAAHDVGDSTCGSPAPALLVGTARCLAEDEQAKLRGGPALLQTLLERAVARNRAGHQQHVQDLPPGRNPDKDDPAAPLFRQALACALAALRLAPHAQVALRERGVALQELGQTDGARDSLTMALAVDPDDPATLAATADLYISRLSTSTEHSEIGLLYARRGRERLLAQHGAQGRGKGRAERGRGAQRHDRGTKGLPDDARALLARLYLLQGQAELDLGHATEGLRSLDESLRLVELMEARYERAIALFELCRFAEAATALHTMLAAGLTTRQTAWAHHQLGLVLEQLGSDEAAERELAMARTLQPDQFPVPLPIDRMEFRSLVDAEVRGLPKASQDDLKLVRLETAELPDVADLTTEQPPLSPTILGLYRGLPVGEEPSEPRSIVLYRRNLLRAVRSRDELIREIRTTLLHELGHLHGADEDDLRDQGLQ